MYWLQRKQVTGESQKVKYYIAETEEDIAKLPTRNNPGTQDNGDTAAIKKAIVGSECFVAETGNVYILSKTDKWIKKARPFGTSGSSSSSSDGNSVIDDLNEISESGDFVIDGNG